MKPWIFDLQKSAKSLMCETVALNEGHFARERKELLVLLPGALALFLFHLGWQGQDRLLPAAEPSTGAEPGMVDKGHHRG